MFNTNSFIVREMRPKRRRTFVTVIFLGFLIAVFLFGYFAFGSEKIGFPNLIQIHVLFRHGERTPSSQYPTDPYNSHEWPVGPGALTNKGKQSMYKLGKTIRTRYQTFLSENYSPDELSVTSSYAARCQMSAMTLLAGLYPPVGNQVWNKNLLWQPIPVNPIPRNIDNLIAAKAPCKGFNIEKDKSDKELHSNFTEENEIKLFKYLSENTNLFVNNIEQVEEIYSILKIEDENGLNIPDWTKSVFPEPLKTFAGMNLASYTRTPRLKRLQGGPLLKEWLHNMEKSKKKVHLYSGHDLTLVNIMRTIGFSTTTFPPAYGATLILEVHYISNKKIVKAVYYKSNQDSEPDNLILPNCGTSCSLESFSNLMEPFIPVDWDQECNSEI